MSACSCGILVLSMQLYKKGASTPAVVAFLLASPWANLPLTLMFIGFFGFFRAVYIVAVAVVIALATGFIFQVLESRNLIERNKNSLGVDEGFSIIKDIQRRCANYQFSFKKFPQAMKGILQNTREISDRVMWWILIGVGLASLAGAYIPQDIFQRHMGPTLAGLMVTLGLATVMEVCSEGTSPVAFEIFRQTGALGNSFAFLMGGVVTDYTEIGLIWQNIGKKTALWLPLVTIPQVIVFAMLANRIF